MRLSTAGLTALVLITLSGLPTPRKAVAQTLCPSAYAVPGGSYDYVFTAPAYSHVGVPYGYRAGSRGYASSYGFASGLSGASNQFFVPNATPYVSAPCAPAPVVSGPVIESPVGITAPTVIASPPVVGTVTDFRNAQAVTGLTTTEHVSGCASATVRSIVIRKRTYLVPASVAAQLSTGTVVTNLSSSSPRIHVRTRSTTSGQTSTKKSGTGKGQSMESIINKVDAIHRKLIEDQKPQDEVNATVRKLLKQLEEKTSRDQAE